MTNLSRRQMLVATTAAATGSMLLPSMVSAKAPLASGQAPSFYRRKVGEFEVTALLDGYIDITHNFWVGIEQATVEQLASAAGLPATGAIRVGVTSYLINQGNRLTLVDSGSADLFGPTAGQFLNTFKQAGYSPDQVDTILVTHMHPDHIGSLISDGRATFPNAEIHICTVDFDYWTSDIKQSNAPDFAKPWFDAAKQVKALYDGRINLFTGGPELVSGISAIPLVGHTPGHTGYRISSAGEDLLIWGDACGVASVQFQHPEAGLAFDVDGATGKATRQRLLDMAAGEGILVASAHLPFPSFGRVLHSGNAYAWQPDEYRFEL